MGTIIGIILIVLMFKLPDLIISTKLQNHDISKTDTTKMAIDKAENSLWEKQVLMNLAKGKYDK